MRVIKIYGIDCGYFEVIKGDGLIIKSPFFIGGKGLDVVFYDDDKKYFGDSTDCKLFIICDGTQTELNAWDDLYIPEVESSVKAEWENL